MRNASRVAIRVDASASIGTGHIRRCLSLAQALTEAGADVCLCCRSLDAVAAQVIAGTALTVLWLPPVATNFTAEPGSPPHASWAGVPQAIDAQDTVLALRDVRIDWLVVDHYAFDSRWHRAVRDALDCRLLVIDDTADRSLFADALLDQNLASDHRHKYGAHVQSAPRWLCGPRFALLSLAYKHAPRYAFHDIVRSIGIFMGGTDPGGVSGRVLAECRKAGFTGSVEIVSTTANPRLSKLQQICESDGQATLTLDAPNLAAFFARHDLQIGAGGASAWERCCIGSPTLLILLAANQLAVVPGLVTLGAASQADEISLSNKIRQLIADSASRRSLFKRSSEIVDGRGAERVALALMSSRVRLRQATHEDAMLLLQWRNHPSIRSVSVAPELIQIDHHNTWLHNVLKSSVRWLYVAEVGNFPIGSVRFDKRGIDMFEVSIYIDPELHGLGLGQCILAAGEQAMLKVEPEGFTIMAHVLAGNAASQRLFASAGYSGGPLHYRKSCRPQ